MRNVSGAQTAIVVVQQQNLAREVFQQAVKMHPQPIKIVFQVEMGWGLHRLNSLRVDAFKDLAMGF